MQKTDFAPDAVGERDRGEWRLRHSVETTLMVIAAARNERAAAPVHAARQQLAAAYGATRLRRRLEREGIHG